MRDFQWSAAEKKVARAAFDLALSREMQSVRHEVQAMLECSSDPGAVWRIHDYLSKKRREIGSKYDYRYSVLIAVFSRLVHEGWLREEDLSGLGPEKLEGISRVLSLGRK